MISVYKSNSFQSSLSSINFLILKIKRSSDVTSLEKVLFAAKTILYWQWTALRYYYKYKHADNLTQAARPKAQHLNSAVDLCAFMTQFTVRPLQRQPRQTCLMRTGIVSATLNLKFDREIELFMEPVIVSTPSRINPFFRENFCLLINFAEIWWAYTKIKLDKHFARVLFISIEALVFVKIGRM